MISKATYKLMRNMGTGGYDIFLIPTGNASTPQELTSRTCRLSIVMPKGVAYDPEQNIFANPLHKRNSSPIKWPQTDSVAIPGTDLVVYAHDLDPNSYWPKLEDGKLVRIFSLSIDAPDVRLWNNDTDPTSAQMPDGSDYSNSFKIGTNAKGGLEEKYVQTL